MHLKASLYRGALLAWPIALLSVPDAYVAIPALVGIVVLFLDRSMIVRPWLDHPDLRRSWQLLFAAFGIYVATGLLVSLFHGYTAFRHYERFLVFLLFPTLAVAVHRAGLRPNAWAMATAIGAMLGLVWAIAEYLLPEADRAHGPQGNAISFGNTAVIMMITCAATLALADHRRLGRIPVLLLLLGLICSILVSLISGTKGGWLVILLTLALLGTSFVLERGTRTRVVATALACAAALSIALSPAGRLVETRVTEAVTGADHWFRTGEIIEYSAGVRLELWGIALTILGEKPLLGHGIEGRAERRAALTERDPSLPDQTLYPSFENEFLNAATEGGLTFASGFLIMMVLLFMSFWRLRRDRDEWVRLLAVTGCLVTIGFLIFSLTVSSMGINALRSVFIGQVIVILALLSNRKMTIGAEDAPHIGEKG